MSTQQLGLLASEAAPESNPAVRPLERIVMLPEIEIRSGLDKATWRREEEAGRAPRLRRVSANRVGLLESEFVAWLNSLKPAPRQNIDLPKAEPRRGGGRPPKSRFSEAAPLPSAPEAETKAQRPRGRPSKSNQVAA